MGGREEREGQREMERLQIQRWRKKGGGGRGEEFAFFVPT